MRRRPRRCRCGQRFHETRPRDEKDTQGNNREETHTPSRTVIRMRCPPRRAGGRAYIHSSGDISEKSEWSALLSHMKHRTNRNKIVSALEQNSCRSNRYFHVMTPLALWARSVVPVSKPASAKIARSSFEDASSAKFGCDLAGPVLKPELPNGPKVFCFTYFLGESKA